MRLDSITLAGFKTFADRAQMVFQSNLTAIVGPNGCGKSNIVDAIHCVLGSTSKNLRAESMMDVIFNGTTARKPVGQASVELIFDNKEGRIGGEYAKYANISIRRELNRDGQSNYYLNGMRCRRRDITDLFLGTGLGNNSYAIIEQGMISRLIEAKPEELRAHIEEAAGTSKYKERRRETENRIKHTRENLDRLNDILEEQTKQLNHLQRQANAAEKYKVLKAEQRLIKAQLQAIFWRELNEKTKVIQQEIQLKETALESVMATLRQIDKEIEHKRFSRTEYQDNMNEIQSSYYHIGTELSRIEQNINYAKERKRQLESDYQQLENSYQELEQQQFEDQSQLAELKLEVAEFEGVINEYEEKALISHKQLENAQENMHQWQERWDDFNQQSAHLSKQAEVERTKIQHLEQKQQGLIARIDRIKEEQLSHDHQGKAEEIALLQNNQEALQIELDTLQERLDFIQEDIQSQRTYHQEAQQAVERSTKQLRDLQAKHASMQALQQIALGKDNLALKTWLNDHQLSHHSRLAENLKVDSGWEVAVEMVLANHLEAICIENFASLASPITQLKNADIAFLNQTSFTKEASATQKSSRALLKDKISTHLSLHSLLDHIYVVENITEAFEFIGTLAPHESIVTRDGIWMSPLWLRVSKSINEKTGVLQREHELKELQQQIADHQKILRQEEGHSEEVHEKLDTQIEDRENLLQQLQIVKAKNSDLLAQIKAKTDHLQQILQKQTYLDQEMSENLSQLQEVEATLANAKTYLMSISGQPENETLQRQTLLESKEDLKNKLEDLRQLANKDKHNMDETKIRIASIQNQIHYLNQNLERIGRQLAAFKDRRETLLESLNTINDPLPELDQELQQRLEERSVIEEKLTQTRATLENLDKELQDLEKNRQQIDNQSQALRNERENMRLNAESLRVKLLTHEEQIVTMGYTLETLLEELLPQEATIPLWEEKIQKIEIKIQRLGPINLAAIDEYADLSSRKAYLDQQQADLLEALTTLEHAIRKIDKETRLRFKETFTKLNDSFKQYFQEIFNGGDAYLELTSDDLLETGVIVKAQPLGKRNSTIHLLSGGEKALTAIALVFAIFSLNPAPFCVLDEVDAPLDDVNVGRFCKLVEKMSSKIQFIFISHNTITIKMAKQLAGVTMNEPGVSRLVSVDIEQAIDMATA